MRKLKSKKNKEEIVEKTEVQEEPKVFNKIDYAIYILFFIMAILPKVTKNPNVLFVVMALMVLISAFVTHILKKYDKNFTYRVFVFFLLSILAWPINILISRFL